MPRQRPRICPGRLFRGVATGPEVRYSVAGVYVEDRGFDPDVFGRLSKYKGGKRVDSGANLLLWRPFDPSVLAGSSSEDASALKVTSAIQTFLDLKKLAGRGEEAAAAVFERLLAGPLRAAADQNKEMRHDGLQSDHPGISRLSRRR